MNTLEYHIKCNTLMKQIDPDLPEEDWHKLCCACKAIEDKTGGAGWVMFRNLSEQGHGYPGEYELRQKFDRVPPMGGLTTIEYIQTENSL